MFLKYAPSGEQERVWVYRPSEIGLKRARVLEVSYSRLAGERKTWDELKVDVIRGAALARVVLLWHFLSLEHPPLRLDDLDPRDGEVRLEFSREEYEAMRDAALSAKSMPAEERVAAVAYYEAEMKDADTESALGKSSGTTDLTAATGPSPSSGPGGGSTSARSSTSGRASRKKN